MKKAIILFVACFAGLFLSGLLYENFVREYPTSYTMEAGTLRQYDDKVANYYDFYINNVVIHKTNYWFRINPNKKTNIFDGDTKIETNLKPVISRIEGTAEEGMIWEISFIYSR